MTWKISSNCHHFQLLQVYKVTKYKLKSSCFWALKKYFREFPGGFSRVFLIGSFYLFASSNSIQKGDVKSPFVPLVTIWAKALIFLSCYKPLIIVTFSPLVSLLREKVTTWSGTSYSLMHSVNDSSLARVAPGQVFL